MQDRWVDVQGLRIHYLTAGEDGPPVLLLHGGGIDSALLSYGPAMGFLADRYSLFAPDWPGYGDSDKPRIQYTMEYYQDYLGLLLDSLSLHRPNLVGLSMGGGIALGFSLRHPERVGKLVLVDSYGLGDEIPYGFASSLLVHMPLINEATWAALERSRWMLRRSLEAIVHDRGVITEEVVNQVRGLLRRPGAGHAWRSFQRSEAGWRGLRTSFVDDLHRLQAPVLILHGEKDGLVPVRWAERAHRLIPDSQLRVFPACGHWLPRERPEQFSEAVSAFLSGPNRL